MDFNNFIESPNKFKQVLSAIFDIERDQYKSKYISHYIQQPQYDAIECLVRSEDFKYTVLVTVEVSYGNLPSSKYECSFTIPKQHKRGFLIKNNDGKLRWRTTINLGIVKQLINVRYKVIYINNTCSISLYNSNINPYVTNNKTKENYDLVQYMIWSGVPSDKISSLKLNYSKDYKSFITDETKFKPIPIPEELIELIKDKYFQLTKNELTNDTLIGSDLYNLVELYVKNPGYYDQFTPFDCEFISQADSLFNELTKGTTGYQLKFDIINYFIKYHKIRGAIITKRIDSFFKMQSRKYNSVQTTSDSNAQSSLSQSNKLYFIEPRLEKQITGYLEVRYRDKLAVQYNEDFIGVVCAEKTPENVEGVNVKNELARSASFFNGKPLVEVLDLNNKKVRLDYGDYYRSRILSSTCWDYEEWKIMPTSDNEIIILRAGQFFRVPYDPKSSQYDYIRPDPESTKSISTALIPFVNHTDSVRVAMASSMMDQAIPVKGSSPPVLYTGVEKEVYEKSDYNFQSNDKGEVIEIVDNYIKLKLPDGSTKVITTPPDTESMNHTYNRYNIIVKPGDKIQKGQTVVVSDSFKDGELSITTTLRSAIMPFYGREEEDGFILSETAAKKLTHILDREIVINIPNDSEFLFDIEEVKKFSKTGGFLNTSVFDKLNEFGLPNVGDKFSSGDIIVVYLVEATNDMIRRLDKISNKGDILMKADVKYTPHNVYECTVMSVDVIFKEGITSKLNSHHRIMNYYKDQYNKQIKKLENLFDNDILNLLKNRTIPKKSDYKVQIRIVVRSENPCDVGNKLTNRYGSKGTVTAVYPDSKMPRIGSHNGEIIEIISSPNAAFNRKNYAQVMEMELIKICRKSWLVNEELIKEGQFEAAKNLLNLLYITDKFSKYNNEQLIKYHKSFNNFYRIKVHSMNMKYNHKSITKLASYLGIKLFGDKMYLPTEDSMTDNPIVNGYSEIMRLHFIPEHKSTATSSSTKLSGEELVLGYGKSRPGGQKQGTMEIWAYISHNSLKNVNDVADVPPFDRARSGLIMHLNLLGLGIKMNGINNEDDLIQ